MAANYCEFFRFDDRFADVFEEEPGRYLYACAEPFGWPYMLACNEWRAAEDMGGRTVWTRCDTVGADAEYLQTLEYAPEEIAADIIRREYARALYYSTRGESCYWFGFDEPPEYDECIEQAEWCAGIIC